MASISTAVALISAAVAAAGAGTTAYMQNDARIDANKNQEKQLAAAKEAANKSTGAITSNVGTVALDSEEALADDAIKTRSKKNRLRVDRTGLSVGGTTAGSLAGSATGLKI